MSDNNQKPKKMNTMNYNAKVNFLMNNVNINLLSEGLGLSVSETIEFVCGDDYTFSMFSKLYQK